MRLLMLAAPQSHDRSDPAFWFVMSTALLVGFIAVYPMNWWLVGHRLNEGRMTVRPTADETGSAVDTAISQKGATTRQILGMTLLSFLALFGGLAIAALFGL